MQKALKQIVQNHPHVLKATVRKEGKDVFFFARISLDGAHYFEHSFRASADDMTQDEMVDIFEASIAHFAEDGYYKEADFEYFASISQPIASC